MIWAVFFVGLLFATFGATAAVALLSVSRGELMRTVSRQLRGGPRTLAWLGQVEHYLTAAAATTSLGVVLIGASVPAVFTGLQLTALALLATLVVVPFVLFSGYLVPRWLAQPRAEAVAAAVVPILRPWAAFMGMMLPARGAQKRDLRSVWREGAAAGVATDEELVMVSGVMTFTERPVRAVMTPRTEVVAVSEDSDLKDIAEAFAQSGYSRLPVFRGSLDEIVGMLHAFDLFKLEPGDPLPIRPVAVAPASRHCGDLLLDMQRERRHLAIVLDEFGGTLGLVTFEDLLEELVGEIFDEHDEEAHALAVGTSGVFEADGSTAPAAIAERFGIALPLGKTSTIGGLLAELAGRIPAPGERLVLHGLEFDVLQASPTRIERLLIRPGPVPLVTLSKAAP